MTENTALVTVTGASGFIALHCVRELLRDTIVETAQDIASRMP